jgi:Ca2+:H+ antiporter
VERVAVVTGPTLGGLVNAIFGNTTALVIALIALKKGLVDIVQARSVERGKKSYKI